MTMVIACFVSFLAGIGCALAVLVLLERRIMAKHGGKLNLALALLDEAAQDGAK